MCRCMLMHQAKMPSVYLSLIYTMVSLIHTPLELLTL